MITASQNTLTLCGKVHDCPSFSHQSHGERFMHFPLIVKRLSDTSDIINVIVNEKKLKSLELSPDDFISVSGELRSFNNKSGIGSRLVITAYAHELSHHTEEYLNELTLSGVVCKEPVYRKTPLGREICDLMLAINRRYGRADYLPCIAWGRNAYISSLFTVGSCVNIIGRIQSRNYIKLIDGVEHPRVTYEVSISSISENSNTIIS